MSKSSNRRTVFGSARGRFEDRFVAIVRGPPWPQNDGSSRPADTGRLSTTWLWGELHPEFMDALMPMVSQPVEIAGRNRMWRRTAMDAIRNDPGWNNGEYQKPPSSIVTVARIFAIAVAGPLDLQMRAPSRDAADSLLDQISARWTQADANDMLYQLDCQRTYNPEPELERIQARLIAINAPDDFINPPELGIMDRTIKRVKNGRYVLVTSTGRGHGTVGDPTVWKQYLEELLQMPTR